MYIWFVVKITRSQVVIFLVENRVFFWNFAEHNETVVFLTSFDQITYVLKIIGSNKNNKLNRNIDSYWIENREWQSNPELI